MRPIDQISEFAERRRYAMLTNKCASCLGPAKEFRDFLSQKEYTISLLCQHCQDLVFNIAEITEDEE
jgi:hypothetical protein